jgi:transcriptional regulator with PAS, ATPase and Fis domain
MAADSSTQRLGHLDAYFEGSSELLHAITGVLDVRTVFPRVSEIANRMLPHDSLAMAFVAPDGQLALEAATGDFPEVKPHAFEMPMPEHRLIGNLETEALPVARGENPTERFVARGYRSFLGVATQARDRMMEVGFWSKRPHAFDWSHVPVARRIADHIALALCHEQLAREAGKLAEEGQRPRPLEARLQRSSEGLNSKTDCRVVGESVEWRDVLRKATQVAATDTTVLLSGESGTGKEVIARFIHRASARRTGPFTALNCAALPEHLLESELFGHERGAFTSAQQAKPGQMELASGGVLFLDEVSEMSLSAQAKFLRALQERQFQRLGGTRALKANIRVIAATNRDLRKAVERGDFREDLYYRLAVFDIHIAPLRERRSDIPPLCEAFLQEIGASFGRRPAGLTHDARAALLRHDWPGNVRELRNALERAAIVCEGELIDAHHLSLQTVDKPRGAVPTDLNRMERDTISRVLGECGWNKSKAAERLGLSRTQLYVRMRRHGLERSAPSLVN